ncbi:unnamed protein product [Cuscuta epithymum]|uniref:RNase H type-1 domain-containing protein n=1 Tax=Cuscuta epithymum TaxID=186058 RepID=A0AAV0G0F1_9ASTE|nr:unnamed protein product [Cuscuta epithymum]
MARAKCFVSGWCQAQFEKRKSAAAAGSFFPNWRRLAPGRLKLNVDAAIRPDHCGLGWCLRDEEDNFVAGKALPWRRMLSSLVAELIGIREASAEFRGRNGRI